MKRMLCTMVWLGSVRRLWAVQQAPSKGRRRFPTMWTRLPPCRTRRLPRTPAHTTGNFPSPLGRRSSGCPGRDRHSDSQRNGRGIQLWGSVLAGAPLRQRQMGDARISPGYGVARHRDPLGPALPERAPHPPGQLLWEGSTHARPLPLWEYV